MWGRRAWVMLPGALVMASCADAEPTASPSSSEEPPPADCAPARPATAGTQRMTIEHDGEAREFDLSVPESFDGATAAPLIVDMHGFTATIEDETALTNLPIEAGARGYVVATPEALPTALPVGDGGAVTFWNVTPVTDGGEAEVEGGLDAADDIGFIEAMITSIENDLCIDADRIHLTGMSNGAGMTMALACSAPAQYASVAPVAAVNLTTSCPATAPIATVAIHGDADPLVDYAGGDVFGFDLGNPSVPDRMAELAGLGGCATEPTPMVLFDDVVRDVWAGCADGVDVELYTVLEGGHEWPGSEVEAAEGDVSSIDATEIILDFFDAHPGSS